MSLPSIVSYGAAAKTSSLVWDGDLVIPDGYAIESASGEVGINGDVSVSGSLNSEGGISSGGNVTAAKNLVGVNAVLREKPLVLGETVNTASVTLEQLSTTKSNYTSPDYTITGAVANVQYILPPITCSYYSGESSGTMRVNIQGKRANGTYTNIVTISIYTHEGATTNGANPPTLIPLDCIALRLTRGSLGRSERVSISSDLSLSLTPQPIY